MADWLLMPLPLLLFELSEMYGRPRADEEAVARGGAKSYLSQPRHPTTAFPPGLFRLEFTPALYRVLGNFSLTAVHHGRKLGLLERARVQAEKEVDGMGCTPGR